MSMYKCCEKTIPQGAATTVYCAVSNLCENETGLYYCNCQPAWSRIDRLWTYKRKWLIQKCDELCEIYEKKNI